LDTPQKIALFLLVSSALFKDRGRFQIFQRSRNPELTIIPTRRISAQYFDTHSFFMLQGLHYSIFVGRLKNPAWVPACTLSNV
jgi:hypothetical protein